MPFVWLDGDQVLGYGELWEDRAIDEAELAREAAGFGRGTPEQEAEFNADQPHVYVWMRDLT